MKNLAEYLRIEGIPPPWSVTDVNKFVIGALDRAQRESGEELPEHFFLSLCPWGERNTLGYPPELLPEVIDPRFRLVHFTGCGRPYLVILFIGENAELHQQIALRYLPWSEHFAVEWRDGGAILKYLSCTEEVLINHLSKPHTLRELLDQGELVNF